MRPLSAALALTAVLGAGPPDVTRQPGAPRSPLCAAVDRAPAEAAPALAALGSSARETLLGLAASSSAADAACGIAGLVALRDVRVVAPLAAALANPAFRADAYRFARWATFGAGGPEPGLGAAYAPLLSSLADPATWAATGEDGARLLGAIDSDAARERLVAELARPQPEAMLDALIRAAGRQGEARPRVRIAAWGDEAVAARSGNLTYEQASRVGAVAAYLLALSPDAFADGLRLLRQLAPRDQQDTAAWAMQTWCERGVRRPAARASATAARAALIRVLEAAGVRWDGVKGAAFDCADAP